MPSRLKQQRLLISILAICLLSVLLLAVGGTEDLRLGASVGTAQEAVSSGQAFPTEEECAEYAAGGPTPTPVAPGEEGEAAEACLVMSQEPVVMEEGAEVSVAEDEATGLICAEIRRDGNKGSACTHADEPEPMIFLSTTGPFAAEIPADLLVADPQRRLGSVQVLEGGVSFAEFGPAEDDGLWIYGYLPEQALQLIDGIVLTDVNQNFLPAPTDSFMSNLKLAQEAAAQAKEVELAAEP
jgi:hypothetical protein